MLRSIVAIFVFPFAAIGTPDDTPPRPSSFPTISRQAEQSRDANRLDEALTLDFPECAAAFQRLVALKKDSVPAWMMSGLCEYRLRRYDAALASLRKAEALEFQEPPELSRAARLHLALILTKTGHFESAIVVLTELTRIHRKSPEIIAAAGIAGLRELWLAFEVPEASRDVVMKLGDAMASAMEQDVKEAIGKFEIAILDYPSEANVRFRFGAFLTQQDPDRGVSEIERALALDSKHVPAVLGLATIYIKRDELPKAFEYSERAVKAARPETSSV